MNEINSCCGSNPEHIKRRRRIPYYSAFLLHTLRFFFIPENKIMRTSTVQDTTKVLEMKNNW
eukprot:475246-Amphidinium_carterae.1